MLQAPLHRMCLGGRKGGRTWGVPEGGGGGRGRTRYPLIQALTRQKARTVSWKSSALLLVARKRRLRGSTLLVSATATTKQPPSVNVTLHTHFALASQEQSKDQGSRCDLHKAPGGLKHETILSKDAHTTPAQTAEMCKKVLAPSHCLPICSASFYCTVPPSTDTTELCVSSIVKKRAVPRVHLQKMWCQTGLLAGEICRGFYSLGFVMSRF